MFAAFLAGVARMPYAEFAAYKVSGGVCWALAMGLWDMRSGSILRCWTAQCDG
jgi:membrane protein DedA with SNARE-associated domain